MPSYLARTGLVVFAMLFAIAMLTERTAAGSALVTGYAPIDPPRLHEVARMTILVAPTVVAGVERAPDPPVAEASIAAPIVVAEPTVVAPPIVVAPPAIVP